MTKLNAGIFYALEDSTRMPYYTVHSLEDPIRPSFSEVLVVS